jgi:lipoate---protein ligase
VPARVRGADLSSREWRVEVRSGPAGELHAAWPAVDSDPHSRAVAVCEPTGPCVVLGSTQSDEQADAARARERGVMVARRRTGGGAVYLEADNPIWIDLWLPADDQLASTDVGRSFDWLGDAWVAALSGLGVRGLRSHRLGAVAVSEWSSLVCFAGIGNGEVLDPLGRKIVGLAQRRIRSGAWFQSACLLRWDPGLLLDTLSLGASERARARRELDDVATGVGDLVGRSMTGAAGHAAVTTALLDSLP